MNKKTTAAITFELSKEQRLAIGALFTIGVYLLSKPSFAQLAPTVIGDILCNAYGLIAIDIGRGLATLAVVTLGIGAMLGRVTWGQAVTVGAGIGTVFGAVGIVGWLTTSILSAAHALSCVLGAGGMILR